MSRRQQYKLLTGVVAIYYVRFMARAANPQFIKFQSRCHDSHSSSESRFIAHVSLKNVSNEKITVGLANGPHQAQVSYKILTRNKLNWGTNMESNLRPFGNRDRSQSHLFLAGLLRISPQMKLFEEDCVISELF